MFCKCVYVQLIFTNGFLLKYVNKIMFNVHLVILLMKLIADLSVVTSECFEMILSFDFSVDYSMDII